VCNLYSLTKARDAIARLFAVPHNRATAYEPLPAIFPGHAAPVVRVGADGSRELVMMSWGFVLPQAGKAPRRVTNMRDDKARRSSFWRESFDARRCLVPATSFAEPHDGRTPATWHWFALRGEEPRPPFAFAGVWRSWRGQIKKDGPTVELDTYAFMTTEPNALTASINHERSPVVLADAEAQRLWLEGAPDEAFAVAAPFDATRLTIVREGAAKTDPAHP
jgi:putative SOS response-associated peptidase YedK